MTIAATVPVSQALPTGHPPFKIPDERKRVIRATIAKDLHEPEFDQLIELAETYGLDPLLGEVWALRPNKKLGARP